MTDDMVTVWTVYIGDDEPETIVIPPDTVVYCRPVRDYPYRPGEPTIHYFSGYLPQEDL